LIPALDSRNAPAHVSVIGAGGHGSELQSYFLDLAAHGWTGTLAGHIDDNAPEGPYRNMRVLGTLARFLSGGNIGDLCYITAVGSNELRRTIVERIESAVCGWTAWTLVHPSAQTGSDVAIGAGTLLAPNSMVTTRVRIGRHSILNVKASVSHDTEIGEYVNLNPGVTVCGKCRIGDGAYIGAGATLIDGVSIGEWAVVVAGAVVVRDIPARCTAFGVPARVIKQR
jgi:acetyltransferase EpsM